MALYGLLQLRKLIFSLNSLGPEGPKNSCLAAGNKIILNSYQYFYGSLQFCKKHSVVNYGECVQLLKLFETESGVHKNSLSLMYFVFCSRIDIFIQAFSVSIRRLKFEQNMHYQFRRYPRFPQKFYCIFCNLKRISY